MYAIEYDEEAVEELGRIRAVDQRRILDAVDQQLAHEPLTITRNRKPLPSLVPAFRHVPPVWELRVGEWRVFYDVDDEAQVVTVRAIRHKGRKTTGEIA